MAKYFSQVIINWRPRQMFHGIPQKSTTDLTYYIFFYKQGMLKVL